MEVIKTHVQNFLIVKKKKKKENNKNNYKTLNTRDAIFKDMCPKSCTEIKNPASYVIPD